MALTADLQNGTMHANVGDEVQIQGQTNASCTDTDGHSPTNVASITPDGYFKALAEGQCFVNVHTFFRDQFVLTVSPAVVLTGFENASKYKTQYPKPITQIIADVVAITKAKILETLQTNRMQQISAANPDIEEVVSDITDITFIADYYVNIERRIQSQLKSKTERFKLMPLVCLILPNREAKGKANGYFSDVTLNMIFCYYTKNDLMTEQRIVLNFEPILRPLYQCFIETLASCGFFTQTTARRIQHDYYELPQWGNRDSKGNPIENIFSMSLDAIEIQNLSLTVNNQNQISQR